MYMTFSVTQSSFKAFVNSPDMGNGESFKAQLDTHAVMAKGGHTVAAGSAKVIDAFREEILGKGYRSGAVKASVETIHAVTNGLIADVQIQGRGPYDPTLQIILHLNAGKVIKIDVPNWTTYE
jgi:hypothetical protein